jgi:hypothetical protein
MLIAESGGKAIESFCKHATYFSVVKNKSHESGILKLIIIPGKIYQIIMDIKSGTKKDLVK